VAGVLISSQRVRICRFLGPLGIVRNFLWCSAFGAAFGGASYRIGLHLGQLRPCSFRCCGVFRCFSRSRSSFSAVFSLISAIEHPVSSNALTRCLSLSWCSTMSITGRVPRMGSFGSFCFRVSPHIIAEVLGCGCSQPLKNPSRILPTAGRQCRCLWFRPLPPSAVCWGGGSPQVLLSAFVFLAPRPTPSMGLVVGPCRFLC